MIWSRTAQVTSIEVSSSNSAVAIYHKSTLSLPIVYSLVRFGSSKLLMLVQVMLQNTQSFTY